MENEAGIDLVDPVVDLHTMRKGGDGRRRLLDADAGVGVGVASTVFGEGASSRAAGVEVNVGVGVIKEEGRSRGQ